MIALRGMNAMRLVALVALACAAGLACAQDYPARGPIRLVVGFAPGGGADALARSIAPRLSEILRQSIVIENKTGAGGSVATDAVAKSAPDGYTVSFTVNSHSINAAMYPKLPFDTERDLRGATLIGSLPQALAANPSARANTLKEFLAVETNRSYGTGGVGSPGHFAAAYLESLSSVEFRHVPYRGAGPAIADVVGGQIPYVLSTLTSVLPHIKAGKLKAIAITSLERSPLVPNVPTIAESGFPGYDMDTWVGTFVPRPTPNAIVKTLHDATVEALNSPDVRQRLEAQGTRIISGPPGQLDALVAEDIKRYTKIVRERGIKAE